MLDGADAVSQLMIHYPAIKFTDARVNSELAPPARKSLLKSYEHILKFQIRGLQYFNPSDGGKIVRTVQGVNPVSADRIKKQREAIVDIRDKVDRDIALLHEDITKHSLDAPFEGKDSMLANQNELLTTTRDGILALARNTGSAFRDQGSLINSRFPKLAAMWSELMETWIKKLEDERIEREKEQLRDVRLGFQVQHSRETSSILMAAICPDSPNTAWASLDERSDPNLKSRRHGLPLEKAASLGKSYKELMSILLDFGPMADLAAKGDQIHILHQAAMYGMVDLARYCLSQCQIDMVSTENR